MGDIATARAILTDERLPRREVAFLSQQAAEKALKASIVFHDTEAPWTHDLLFLRGRAPDEVRTAAGKLDLKPLWAAASASRYPDGDDPPYDRDEVERLLEDAAAIVAIVRRHLGDAGMDVSGMEPM